MEETELAPVSDSVEYKSTTNPEASEPKEAEQPDKVEKDPTSKEDAKAEPKEEAVKVKKPGKLERAILKLERELADERSQRKLEKEQVEKLQGKPQEKDPKAEPQESDYANVVDYFKDYNKWAAKQEFESFNNTQKQQAKETAYFEKVTPLLQENPQIAEVIDTYEARGWLKPEFTEALFESPAAKEITEHLATHPEDMQAIAQASGQQLYRMMGMMEATLKQRSEQAAPARKTQAAAPIKPIGKQSSSGVKAPAEMSQSEYEAWRYPSRN